MSAEQDSDSPWHTVSRRRARSLDSAETANKVQKRRGQAPKGKNSAKEAATKNQDNDIPQKQELSSLEVRDRVQTAWRSLAGPLAINWSDPLFINISESSYITHSFPR